MNAGRMVIVTLLVALVTAVALTGPFPLPQAAVCAAFVAAFMLGRSYEKRIQERPRRWIDLRLVKRTGDPGGTAYVETRDLMDGIKAPAYRKVLEQANNAKTAEIAYRYEVRVFKDGESIESRRFLRGDKAEEFHNEKAALAAVTQDDKEWQ